MRSDLRLRVCRGPSGSGCDLPRRGGRGYGYTRTGSSSSSRRPGTRVGWPSRRSSRSSRARNVPMCKAWSLRCARRSRGGCWSVRSSQFGSGRVTARSSSPDPKVVGEQVPAMRDDIHDSERRRVCRLGRRTAHDRAPPGSPVHRRRWRPDPVRPHAPLSGGAQGAVVPVGGTGDPGRDRVRCAWPGRRVSFALYAVLRRQVARHRSRAATKAELIARACRDEDFPAYMHPGFKDDGRPGSGELTPSRTSGTRLPARPAAGAPVRPSQGPRAFVTRLPHPRKWWDAERDVGHGRPRRMGHGWCSTGSRWTDAADQDRAEALLPSRPRLERGVVARPTGS